MSSEDRVKRRSTALAVVGVPAIAAVESYEHAYDLVRAHGELGSTDHLIPLTVDGLNYAISMVMWTRRAGRGRSGAGAVGAGPGHRGDTRGQRGA